MAHGESFSKISLLSSLVIISNLRICEGNKTDLSDEDKISAETPTALKQPKLLVFSLDMVIWPFRVDKDVVTPVKKNKKSGRVQDFVLKDLGIYAHALDALNTLYLKKMRLAVVSDSADVETNTKLLLYFNLYNYFPIQEIFGGPKRQHLEVIHHTTQVPFEDMFYFDVKNDQLDGIRQMGVHVAEVDCGVEIMDFDKALNIYNNVTKPEVITTSSVQGIK